MKTKDIKKGISLIVLIITIIVVIILAAVVILTLSKNNPIESAKEARFKEDVRTFQDELALTVSKQYIIAGGHRDEKITTSDFDAIKEHIPSFSEKYKDKFIIQDDELRYTNKLDDKEEIYAQSLNVKSRLYTELEYIESTGTQWIDTKLKLPLSIEIKAKYNNFNSSYVSHKLPTLLGCQNASEPFNSTFIRFESNMSAKSFGNYVYRSNVQDLNIHQYKLICFSGNSKFFLDGVLKGTSNLQASDNQHNLYLFATDNGGTSFQHMYGRIYYVKMYSDAECNTMICDYIPVLDSNNKPALYDKIEGKFYYNQGTGEDFIAGPDVNE